LILVSFLDLVTGFSMKVVVVYYLHGGTVCAPRAGTGWTDTGETWHCREVQTHAAEVCPHHEVVTRLHADALLLLSFPLSVSLSGCTHMVHTGVTLVWRDGRGGRSPSYPGPCAFPRSAHGPSAWVLLFRM